MTIKIIHRVRALIIVDVRKSNIQKSNIQKSNTSNTELSDTSIKDIKTDTYKDTKQAEPIKDKKELESHGGQGSPKNGLPNNENYHQIVMTFDDYVKHIAICRPCMKIAKREGIEFKEKKRRWT